MATHIGVTDTLGITLPTNAEAQSAQRTQTVENVPTTGADGELKKLQPAKTLRKDLSVTYVGAPDFSNITSAQGLTTTTVKKTRAEMTEEPNKPNAGTITASTFHAFADDQSGTGAGAGSADTDIGTIIVKSCTATLADSVRRTVEVKDVVVAGGAGTPGWRGTCMKKGSFSVRFKGDIPTGIVLGTSGAGLYAFSGGVICVNRLVEDQKADDVNGGSFDGEHAPSAS